MVSLAGVTLALGAAPGAAQTPGPPRAGGVVTETFVDKSRPTAANGDCAKIASRALPTTIYYPASSGGPYPLIVFAHGFGATSRTYAKLLEHLASSGYVVAAPTFPLSSGDSPCGAISGDAVNQPEDLSFVVDSVLKASARASGPLSGLVDRNSIGAAGHSNGAVTTWGLVANSKVRDPRIDAAVVMAGTLQKYPTGVYDFAHTPPLLLVHGSNDSLVPYDLGVQAFNEAHGPKGLLTLSGGDHGSASGPNAYAATTDFFDAYLRGDAAAKARLPGDQTAGVSTMQFDAAEGLDHHDPDGAAAGPEPEGDRVAAEEPHGRPGRDGAVERLRRGQGREHPPM